MALPAAVACGMVAAVAVPWLARNENGAMGQVLQGSPLRLPLGQGIVLDWSWPVFAVVTLLAWGLLAAARGK